jgi:hypothetical protein
MNGVRKQAEKWVSEFRESSPDESVVTLLPLISADPTTGIAIRDFVQLSHSVRDYGRPELPPISLETRSLRRTPSRATALDHWADAGRREGVVAEGPFVADLLDNFTDFPNRCVVSHARWSVVGQRRSPLGVTPLFYGCS